METARLSLPDLAYTIIEIVGHFELVMNAPEKVAKTAPSCFEMQTTYWRLTAFAPYLNHDLLGDQAAYVSLDATS